MDAKITIDKEKNKYYSRGTDGKFLFIRHGKTAFNEDPDTKGRLTNPNYLDCKLDQNGIDQAISMQSELNKLKIEAVYVSPFYRAQQTLSYALQSHPNAKNIKVIVHPLASEITSCVNDYIFNIQETKKFESKLKIDWSLFDEFIKNSKYIESLYFFDHFDCFDENVKNEKYNKLKEIYEKGDLDAYRKALGDFAKFRFDTLPGVHPESYKHLLERFNKFGEFLKEKHKNTLDKVDEKVLVFCHRSIMKIGTDRTPYESKNIQVYNPGCYEIQNCEILSMYF